MDDNDIKRVEAHLKRTFGNPHVAVKARPKQKDSAEVEMKGEFIGVIYQTRTRTARSCSKWRSWPRIWSDADRLARPTP